jgi:hypothetical protein
MHDLQIVFVIEFIARKDAELVSGAKESDRDHQGADKSEGVRLREGKIVRHLKTSIQERANSR